MNKKTSLRLLAATLGLASVPALAGECQILPRAMGAGIAELVTISCKHNSAVATVAQIGTSPSATVVNLVSAAQGSGAFALVSGLDTAGFAIASCTIQDFTFGSGFDDTDCPNGVRWSGRILHAE